MSAKIAIVIGDYSNGWSDSIIVQNCLPFKQEKFQNDQSGTMAVLTHCLLEAIEKLVSNEKINPKPVDDPCCDKFEEWAKSQTVFVPRCPYCGVKINDERKKKFFTNLG